ncbi:hypothetical protein L5515_008270 [Caenorhabditis briggsae]|uniref:Elongator complex protein 6 n=2 Tax=Caenorhabditis briggsae TaxID=6238 RepID=A0AAE9A2N0_CAEBR|nr:hypothetical protein L3Y34_008421 [Caenorhabditis briggsae]UMM35821.1 hypothetical protein L5515_008270 [Caenorhabditis briggsae]
MIKILKGQEYVFNGLVVCEELGNASSLPMVLHFLSVASTSNQKVTIITSKYTETNYKLVCSKAGIRWVPSQINFLEILQPFGSFDVDVKQTMDDLIEKISGHGSSVILFDDVSLFEQLGTKPVEVVIFLHKIYSHLKKAKAESSVLFAPFSICSTASTLLQNRCRVFVQMTPVGHGFGKDASSKAVFTIRSQSGPTTKKGILLSGERTINGSWVSVE